MCSNDLFYFSYPGSLALAKVKNINKNSSKFKNFVNKEAVKFSEEKRDLFKEMDFYITEFEKNLSHKQRKEFKKIRSIIDEDDYEYNDNERVCIIGDTKSENLYEQVAARGCCGFYDEEFELSDGIKIRYGFNFGH